MLYFTLRTIHIILIVSWFAGLFYLPRIFVNLAMVPAESHAEYDRLLLMSKKLYRFMTPIGIVAVILGLWIWYEVYSIKSYWLHAKSTLTILLLGYNFYSGAILKTFENKKNSRSHIWFRYYNEAPTLILFLCVYLVIFKPF